MRHERKKIWINIFQTKLLIRIGAYWVIYLATIFNFMFVIRLLAEGPGNPVEQYGQFLAESYPTFVLFFLLLPIVALDAIKFSHRLVGPLVRFRQTVIDITQGIPVQPIKLRKDDYLTEFRDEFNAMIEALQRQGIPVLKGAETTKESEQQRCSA